MANKFSFPVNEVQNIIIGMYTLEFSLRDDGFSIKINHEDRSDIYEISEDTNYNELSFRFTTENIEKNFLAGSLKEHDMLVQSFEIPQFSITIIVDEDQHLNLYLKENHYKFEKEELYFKENKYKFEKEELHLNESYATINLLFKQ